jgi:hypothetical protein
MPWPFSFPVSAGKCMIAGGAEGKGEKYEPKCQNHLYLIVKLVCRVYLCITFEEIDPVSCFLTI